MASGGGRLDRLQVTGPCRVTGRRAAPLAAAVVTAILGLGTAGAAGPPESVPPAPAARVAPGETLGAARPQRGEATAALLGVVSDPQQAVIAGAKLTLVEPGTGAAREVLSSEEGEYRFAGLREGSYTLRVEAPGFAKAEIHGVRLRADQEKQLDATLQVGMDVLSGVIVEPLRPLRALYQEAALVAVARLGESQEVERTDEHRLLKTALHISATLKSDAHQPLVDLYHWVSPDEPEEFAAGDLLLVLLTRYKDKDGREIVPGYEASARRAIRKLSARGLRVHRERIAELAAMPPGEEVETAELVEWLVRCAEDPATRWDGATDLMSGTAGGGPREAANPAAPLTAEQKERLVKALLKTEQVAEDDLALIELVREWDDERLTPFLVTQLRRVEAAPPLLAEILLRILGEALGDEVRTLADEYSEQVSYEDQEEPEGAEEVAAARRAVADRSARLRGLLRLVEGKVRR